jgi:hypothetical protein
MANNQIYINPFFHVEDYYNPELSAYAVKRVVEILSKHHVKVDFYLTGITAQNLDQQDKGLTERLLEVAGGIGYHGDLHVPGTSPQEKIKEMDWDRAVRELFWIETHNVDGAFFQNRKGKWPEGGLCAVERIIGMTPFVSVGGGVAGIPQVIHVHRSMGVKMTSMVNPVFEEQSTFFSYLNTVGWCITFVPRNIRKLAGLGEGILKRDRLFTVSDVTNTIESITAFFDEETTPKRQSGKDCLPLLSIPFHEYEIYSHDGWRGPFRIPDDVEKFLSQFERLISFLETEPRIKTISLCEISELVAEAPASMKQEEIKLAALDLKKVSGKRPPKFLEVNGNYFSISELFQALLESLAFYTLHGKFPESVVLRGIIGPTVLTDPLVSSLTISKDQLFMTALYENARLIDRVPGEVVIAGTEWMINPSEMLYLLAEAFLKIARGEEPGPLEIVPSRILPRGAEEVEDSCLNDEIQKAFSLRPMDKRVKESYLLQLWTYKPMALA